MSAASQRPHPTLRDATKINGDKANVEPSMEEILASIRRIIADDQAHLAPLPLPDSVNATMDDDTNAITFEVNAFNKIQDDPSAPHAESQEIEATTASTQSAKDISPQSNTRPTAVAAENRDAAITQQASIQETKAREEDRLLSSAANASASSAFDSLSSLVLSRNPRTLDDLVQDMLRPLLKAWLDENLPPLVEKLVRAEIERIARGNR